MKLKVKIEGKSYQVEIEDIQSRPVIAEVDGEKFEVWPEESSVSMDASRVAPRAQVAIPQAKSAGASPVKTPATSGSGEVVAPIPGVVVSVSAQPGDKVVYGQELCVLEAMKMKNSIRAGRVGVIKTVHAVVGEHVHQSQLLIEFENEEQS